MPRKRGQMKCLNCKAKAKWRGVCQKHYSMAKRQINSGEMSDDQLVKSGFWLAPQKGPASPDLVELRRKLAASK